MQFANTLRLSRLKPRSSFFVTPIWWGYDSLVEFLGRYRLGQIDVEFLEISSFLGGTAKLSQLATA